MSFAEISKLPQVQQDEVVGGMNGKEKLFYKRWYAEAANQTGQAIDTETQAIIAENVRLSELQQAAIADGKTIDTGTQAIIDEVIQKIPQVIPLYEADVQQGKKLSIKEKIMLE